MAPFCTNCGNQIEGDWNVCPNCGSSLIQQGSTPQPAPAPQQEYISTSPPPAPKSGGGTGTAALVFGILGLFIFGFIFGLIAIILG